MTTHPILTRHCTKRKSTRMKTFSIPFLLSPPKITMSVSTFLYAKSIKLAISDICITNAKDIKTQYTKVEFILVFSEKAKLMSILISNKLIKLLDIGCNQFLKRLDL